MRKYFFAFIVSVLISTSFINAKGLTAYFNYASFATNKGETYVETYLSIPQHQLKHIIDKDGKFISQMQVSMVFYRNDSIIEVNKYALNSLPVVDTSNINVNIIDIQRLFLDNGDYILELKISDKNNPDISIEGKTQVKVDISNNNVASSTITFIDSMNKSQEKNILTKVGYDMVPYFTNFFPDKKDVIIFYNELYNIDKILPMDSEILVYTQVERYEIPGSFITDLSMFKKMKVTGVIPILTSINIKELPSGNYNIVITVKDPKGEDLILTKKFFQRENSSITYDQDQLASVDASHSFIQGMNNIDSLRMIVKKFEPISTKMEKEFIKSVDKITETTYLKNFIVKFWMDRYGVDATRHYKDYMVQVDKVDEIYSNSIKKGHQTDRGRVYLKYGAPNHVHRNEISSATIPFEIWQYYQLPDGQRDKRFVFATQDLAIKDFELIHSNVVGEISNPKWQYDLYNNAPIIDDNIIHDEMWGSKIQEYYDNPR